MMFEGLSLPPFPTAVVPPGFSGMLQLGVWVPGEWLVLDGPEYTALDGTVYRIPKRFITDLASIPRLFRSIYDIDDESRLPATLHDWLYCSHAVTRAQADALFLEALTRAGVGWVKRNAMYSAVRAGGWRYWNARTGIQADDFYGPIPFFA